MKCSRHLLTSAIILFSITFSKAQNYGVIFTSSASNYIDCGSNSALNANNILTMEAWVKFNTLTSDMEILSRSIGSQGIEVLYFGGNLAFYCMKDVNNGSFISYPGSNLTAGIWYHIAVAWDGTNASSMRLYVNGVSVGTLTSNGSISTGVTNPTGTFRIGNWSDAAPRYLNGIVDEVRVWSVTRTQAQIKAGMYGTVATNTSGLTAYYNFNLNAGAGTTVTNATGNTALNGTFIGSPSPAWTASPIQSQTGAISFNGSTSTITAPANTNYNSSIGTVEFWVMPTNWNTAQPEMCMLGVRGHSTTNYSLHIANGHVGLFNGVYSFVNYSFSLNTWYHLAFVSNGINTTIYVNGSPLAVPVGVFGSFTGNPLVMGLAYSVPTGTQEPFAGALDEVRIWNTARTQAQIQANMNTTLTGSETGLVGLYSMDQGVPGGSNLGLTTVIDNSPTNNPATMASFALTGSTSNWITHPIGTLPVIFSSFTGSRKDDAGVLSWTTAQEQNSKNFVVERSSDGAAYTDIGTIPAAGNSSTPLSYSFTDFSPLTGNNFYRLREVDLDGKFMYSPILTINFTGASGAIKLWPNPAASAITWSGQTAAGPGTLIVSDLSGRTLLTKTVNFTSGTNRVSINLTNLPAGVYFLTVKDKNQTMNKQFQVVR
ncbi:MAG: T9SS type A sorting domain-containing protein [Bacteroidetes bacterium]|nr:T9SS type A sorting domain-containing protein [Bacteroidota bacterium]